MPTISESASGRRLHAAPVVSEKEDGHGMHRVRGQPAENGDADSRVREGDGRLADHLVRSPPDRRLFEDYLRLWKERNMGWALWNLRGSIGVRDSERQDVEYEDIRGHRLDRKMLDLLQRY